MADASALVEGISATYGERVGGLRSLLATHLPEAMTTSPRKRGEVETHIARFSASARSVFSHEKPPSLSGARPKWP